MQKQHFGQKALGTVHIWYGRFVAFLKRMGWVKVGVAVVVALVVALIVPHFFSSTPADATDTSIHSVDVASVLSLTNQDTPLSIIGSVDSKSSATVSAETSGSVAAVYRQLGDSVSAGSIIVELEDSSQRAALLQAQGALDAANAAAGVSGTTLSSAQSSAVTTLLSAYAAVDNAVRANTDPMFSGAASTNPQLNVPTSDSQAKVDAQNDRLALNTLLTREAGMASSLSVSSNLTGEITTTAAELRQVAAFYDDLLRALNAGIATNGISDANITADKATASSARASITGALSSLIAAQQTLDTAQKNGGAQGAASSAAQAAITQAQGGVAAAQANLEKSILRSPISGTINSLSLKPGDFVASFSPVFTVANNNALEVVAYVTESDARTFAVGNSVNITGGLKGVVTRIAPAIDPTTGKIEVRIGVVDPAASLTNGQSVTVDIARTPQKATDTSARITLPISALKIGADDIEVFTVDATHTLVGHAVTIGTLLGDRVVITQGVTPDMNIVVDARGLQAGEVVFVR